MMFFRIEEVIDNEIFIRFIIIDKNGNPYFYHNFKNLPNLINKTRYVLFYKINYHTFICYKYKIYFKFYKLVFLFNKY